MAVAYRLQRYSVLTTRLVERTVNLQWRSQLWGTINHYYHFNRCWKLIQVLIAKSNPRCYINWVSKHTNSVYTTGHLCAYGLLSWMSSLTMPLYVISGQHISAHLDYFTSLGGEIKLLKHSAHAACLHSGQPFVVVLCLISCKQADYDKVWKEFLNLTYTV